MNDSKQWPWIGELINHVDSRQSEDEALTFSFHFDWDTGSADPVAIDLGVNVARDPVFESTYTVSAFGQLEHLTLEAVINAVSHELGLGGLHSQKLPAMVNSLLAIELSSMSLIATKASDLAKQLNDQRTGLKQIAFTLDLDQAHWKPPADLPKALQSMTESVRITLQVDALSEPAMAPAKAKVHYLPTLMLQDRIPLPKGLQGALLINIGIPLVHGGSLRGRALLVDAKDALGQFQAHKVTLGGLLGEFVTLPHALGSLNKIEISAFDIGFDTAAHTQDFNLVLRESWSPLEGEDKLQLEEAQLELAHSPDGMSGEISCTLILEPMPKKDSSPPLHIFLDAQMPGPGEGWHFEGKGYTDNHKGLPLDLFVERITALFGANTQANIPDVLNDFHVTVIDLTLETKSGDLNFELDGEIPLHGDSKIDTKLKLKMVRNAAGQREITFTAMVELSGVLDDPAQFEIAFGKIGGDKPAHEKVGEENGSEKTQSRSFAVGSFHSDSGVKISTGNLLFEFSGGQKSDGFVDLVITLRTALIAWESGGNMLFGLDLGAGVNLSHLKLPGIALGADGPFSLGVDLNLMGQRGIGSGQLVSDIEMLKLPVDLAAAKNPAKKAGWSFNPQLKVSSGTHQFKIDLMGSGASGQGSLPPAAPQTGTVAVVPPADTQSTGSQLPAPVTFGEPHWLPLHGQFGPVHVSKIGLAAASDFSAIKVDIYGGIEVGGLTLSLMDFNATLKKSDPDHPKFSLNGMDLDYHKGGIQISGGFLRTEVPVGSNPEPTVTEFNGEAVISGDGFTLSALGSFAQTSEGPSLFIYADLHEPMGGPAFFFVTGVAAGFGLHRRLRMPSIENVPKFSLVEMAMGSLTGIKSPEDALAAIADDVPIDPGNNFFCAGVSFTSFKIVDSFLLLSVQFGTKTRIDLLGNSKLTVPPDVPAGTPLLAKADLAVHASYIPDEGSISVLARLTSDSFVLSPDCHLTGGFAMATWVKGDHAGDFVLTLGGYHPTFKPQPYYPQSIPRLGFNWKVSSILSLSGGLYYALTGHCFMAGGALHARLQCGPVSAWFDCGADFIVAFKPFHYDASLFIAIGARVSIDLGFTSLHINISAGASLHIWGPSFTGHAHVTVKLMGFHVHFDADFGSGPPLPRPIAWNEFATSFLHCHAALPGVVVAPKVASLAIERGLIKQVKDGDASVWIVNPHDLVISASSAIPSSNIALTGEKKGDVNWFSGEGLSIHPMGRNDIEDITLTLQFCDGDVVSDPPKAPLGLNDHFAMSEIRKSLPAGLWGRPVLTPDDHLLPMGLNEKSLVKDCLVGLSIKAQEPQHTYSNKIKRNKLKFETFKAPNTGFWVNDNHAKIPKLGEKKKNDLDSALTRSSKVRDQVLRDMNLGSLDPILGEEPSSGWRTLPTIIST